MGPTSNLKWLLNSYPLDKYQYLTRLDTVPSQDHLPCDLAKEGKI